MIFNIYRTIKYSISCIYIIGCGVIYDLLCQTLCIVYFIIFVIILNMLSFVNFIPKYIFNIFFSFTNTIYYVNSCYYLVFNKNFMQNFNKFLFCTYFIYVVFCYYLIYRIYVKNICKSTKLLVF